IACNGTCTNPLTSNLFCGATGACGSGDAGSPGVACAPGTVCSNGSCALTCESGFVICSNECIDPKTSNQFCGAAAGCAGAMACTSGPCVNGLCQSGPAATCQRVILSSLIVASPFSAGVTITYTMVGAGGGGSGGGNS